MTATGDQALGVDASCERYHAADAVTGLGVGCDGTQVRIGLVETVVQWVHTSWTKKSRGGAEASRRNSAPVGFQLPAVQALFVHEVSMAERDGFQPRSETHEGLGRARAAALILREADGLLRVQLTVTPFGMPRRWRRPPAVRLGYGEWLRWQINYRFAGTCDGEWTYRLETLNVAHCPVSADIFLGAPTRHVKELAPCAEDANTGTNACSSA